MKRTLAAAVLVGAVMIPAVAVGGPGPDPEYGGKLEKGKNSYFGFDVKGTGDDRKITNGFVMNMRFKNCADNRDSGELERSVPVKKNGEFDKVVEYDFGPPKPRRGGATGLRYHLKGDLEGDKATGTLEIKLFGTGGCESGKQEFKAKKPAPPTPPGPFRASN